MVIGEYWNPRSDSIGTVGILRFNSRLRQNALFFGPYLRRWPTEWHVGGLLLQILGRKFVSMACIQSALCGYRNCRLRPQCPHVRRGRTREALPLLRLTLQPYPYVRGQVHATCRQSDTAWNPPHSSKNGYSRISMAGWAAGEHLRKDETQSLTGLGRNRIPSCSWYHEFETTQASLFVVYP